MTSNIKSRSYISGQWHQAQGEVFQSWDPVNNCAIGSCHSCNDSDVNVAMQSANLASQELTYKSASEIANFMRVIAEEIETLGDILIHTAMQETGLPEARLQGERGRTCGQIRAFATLVEDGTWVAASIDTAEADRQPLPKPDIRSMFAPIGPVIIFGASNFPFAFGSLGGDTASALAAGNPVVVKGHPSHPATSTLFAQAVDHAIKRCAFPIGTFSLLQGNTNQLGAALVKHPFTKAVGFTGSVNAGRALMDIAAARPKPISVYAEMGSINPVFIMPNALNNNTDSIAAGLAASITMGAGQFCTSPGLIVTLKNETFVEQLSSQLSTLGRGYMLNPGIASKLANQLNTQHLDSDIELVSGGIGAENEMQPYNTLMKTNAKYFLATPQLSEEMFGPVSMLVECESVDELQQVAEYIEGNLTATIHTDNDDQQSVKQLLNTLSKVAGRVLFNGYPTGVEVCPSMQHGGSYPASSAPATSSVGTAAITRFVIRVAYQNCPDELLPPALKNSNPLGIWRQLNSEFTKASVITDED